MGVGEIIFLIFLLVLVGFIIVGGIVCVVGFEIRVKRYEKFYKTTELGQDLLALLKIIEFTEEDIESYNEILKTTAGQIDEIESYYPNETYYVEKVNGLKQKYLETKKQLAGSEEYLSAGEMRLEKMKKELPKKCKDILEYDWRNIEGETNES